MINKLLPHAAHLLVALKKTIPAVLLLGTLSLVSAPTARAQILFSVDAFTTDLLTITLHPGSLFGDTVPGFLGESLTLVGAPLVSNYWVLDHVDGVSSDVWGSPIPTASSLFDDENNVVLIRFQYDEDLPVGAVFNESISFSFVKEGGFDATNVEGFALYWGYVLGPSSVLQSYVGRGDFGGSAVPEPSSFAAGAGLAVLGLAGTRRRRTAAANA
jgi:MYXO-CTERM domain-containing protein